MSLSYLNEIHEQPEAIRKLQSLLTDDLIKLVHDVAAAMAKGTLRHVVLTGMGGSLYSAYGTWLRLSEALPIPVSLWDTSELIQQAPGLLREGTLVIAISQSGESVELRRLVELDVASSVRVSITNRTDNSLSRWAHISLATNVGPEETVSTKTYSAGLVALHLLERLLVGNANGIEQQISQLADTIAAELPRLEACSSELLEFIGHDHPIVFIGRGSSLSSANMAALVTAEAAKAPTQGLSGGQFRHGPLELVRNGFRSVLFLGSGPTRVLNEKTVADIVGLGGRCVAVGAGPMGNSLGDGAKVLALPYVTDALMPVVEILPIQLLMVPMAQARGFEPAKFLNGSKVTLVE